MQHTRIQKNRVLGCDMRFWAPDWMCMCKFNREIYGPKFYQLRYKSICSYRLKPRASMAPSASRFIHQCGLSTRPTLRRGTELGISARRHLCRCSSMRSDGLRWSPWYINVSASGHMNEWMNEWMSECLLPAATLSGAAEKEREKERFLSWQRAHNMRVIYIDLR